ncbi:MAG: aminopeptidase P family protein [Eubacteriales bacterium]|nr:aminopeptidase P family protein [Eubacteriales bacterium]
MGRTERLMDVCGLKAGEGIIIHKPANVFYLSGYTGEGLLLLSRGLSAIVTDFRYVEQAQNQAPGFEVHQISTGETHAQVAASLIHGAGITGVYYEDDYVTVRDGRKLKEALGEVQLWSLDMRPEQLREIKDDGEAALIEKACAISCEAFDYIITQIKPGMTEKQIQRALNFRMLELGADDVAFDTIVASGPNGSLPHAIPGERQIEKGDMITLDFGAKFGGYCADMTRTVALGQPGSRMREIYDIVLSAQIACQEALAPGRVSRDVDAIARKIIGDAGYAERFGHGLGHAVGIDIHENPRLSPTCMDTLKPGHVVTVEPGIYVPGLGGVRIENSCLVTDTGARSLVSAPREMIIL